MRRELQGVLIDPDDGAARILTERGQLRLSEHGRATTEYRPKQAYAFQGIVRHIHYPLIAVAIGEWLTVFVALFFLYAGIRIWRNPARGIRLQICCATIGIIVAIAAGVASIVADPNNPFGILGQLILALPQTITLIYAAIVLAFLTRNDVRKYVRSLEAEALAEPAVR
jgi:hypothetical protein